MRTARLTCKVAINGLGRIGRAILKLVVDEPSFDLVAINDLIDVENLALSASLRHGLRTLYESGRGRR